MSTAAPFPPPAAAPPPPSVDLSSFSTLLCTTPEELERSLRIRYEVFCVEQGYDPKIEVDDRDKDSDHILLIKTHENGTVEDVATVRWFAPLSKLGRFAVHAPYRGLGLGTLLGTALEEHIHQRKGRAAERFRGKEEAELVANSQCIALGYYLKRGWRTEGEEFIEEGQPHIKVVKTIQLRPE
ncbi:hypothetical protein JCM8547_002388 [Rhodosporidiobolus lusitaniae]